MSGVTAGTHQECSCLKKWQWSRGRASTTCSGWLRAPCRSVVCTPRSWDLWCSPGSTNRRLGKKGGTEMEGERKGSGRDRQKGKVRKWELSKQSERSDWQGFSPMRCLHTGVQHSAAQKQTSGKKKEIQVCETAKSLIRNQELQEEDFSEKAHDVNEAWCRRGYKKSTCCRWIVMILINVK